MTKEEIKKRIKNLEKLKIDKFLTIDEKTDGFYSGKIAVYQEWLNTLNV